MQLTIELTDPLAFLTLMQWPRFQILRGNEVLLGGLELLCHDVGLYNEKHHLCQNTTLTFDYHVQRISL